MSTCRASRLRLRRHRRRRWIARRSAFKPQPKPQRTIGSPIERNGIELRPDAEGIQLSTIEYHAGPAHLTPEDLALCGLAPIGARTWPESVAARWLEESKVRPDRSHRGPALRDPSWSYPPGLERNGFLIARVRDGLDIFALSYDTKPTHLTDSDLWPLALAWR